MELVFATGISMISFHSHEYKNIQELQVWRHVQEDNLPVVKDVQVITKNCRNNFEGSSMREHLQSFAGYATAYMPLYA